MNTFSTRFGASRPLARTIPLVAMLTGVAMLLATLAPAQTYSLGWGHPASGGGQGTADTLTLSGSIGFAGVSSWTSPLLFFTSQPQSITNGTGTAASFSVSVVGASPVGFQWFKNGTNALVDGGRITGATTTNLSVSSLILEDAGNYRVVVSNASGSITSFDAALTVLDWEPPTLTCPPDVLAMSDAGQCFASPKNILLGTPLASDNSGTFTVTSNAPAQFPIGTNVVTWTAFDASGNTNSCAQRVIVSEGVPLIVSAPANAMAPLSGTASFTVVATACSPVSYRWRLGGNNLYIPGADLSTLTLSNITAGWAGNYDVVVSTPFGSTTSTVARLDVVAISSMVSWWRAEGTPVDSAGSNHGTPSGGVFYNLAKSGTGFTFDSDDDRIMIPHSTNLDVHASGFTCEFWMKGIKNQPQGLYLVVDKSLGSTDQSGWGFQGTNSTGVLDFICGSGTNWVRVSSGDVLDGNFHHVAGIWNGGSLAMYVDGTLRGSSALTSPSNNTRSVNIGYWWGGGTPARFFRGQVDELTVYKRALSSNEIGAIYQAGSAGKGSMAPAIVAQPQDKMLLYGSSLSLSVSAIGTERFWYQWRKNGAPLAGAISTSYSISSARFEHAGDYDVVVTNLFGAATSEVATVTVEMPPEVLWSLTYGGTGADSISAVITNRDGGYLLGGTSSSTNSGSKTTTNYGSTDFWVVKVNANGEKLWEANLGGSSYDYLTALQEGSDGMLYVGGYSQSGASGNKTSGTFGGYDYWLVKLDPAGTKLWETNYGGTSTDHLQAMCLASDGNLILAGSSSSGLNGNKTVSNSGSSDYWLLKVNTNGMPLWQRTLGGTNADYANAITTTPDGGIFVGDSSRSAPSGNKTSTYYGGYSFNFWVSGYQYTDSGQCGDYWVVKMDGSGNEIWENSYGGDNSDGIRCLAPTSDGTFLGGWTYSYGGTGNKTAGYYGGYMHWTMYPDYSDCGDFWVVKIDQTGVKLWERDLGTSYRDDLYGVLPAPNDTCIIAGLYYSGAKLSKYGATGTAIWERNLAGTPYSLAQTSDGAFLVAGSSGNDFWLAKVAATPPIITVQPASTNLLLGGSFTLAAQATASSPVSYRWRKNNTSLSDGGRISGSATLTLVVTNAQIADAASYDLVITNALGSVTSIVAVVTVNRPPVPVTDSAGVSLAQMLTIPALKLLANDSDPDGDPLTVTAVTSPSTMGATVSLASGMVTYNAPVSGTSDSFTYTVSDGRGGSALGTVNVTLSGGSGLGFNQLTPTVLPGGDLHLNFLGIPGLRYALDWTHDLGEPEWTPLMTNQVMTNGWLFFTNRPSVPGPDFYRTRHVP
jgi:hypothetical protein